ncbi:MAG: hypothetical protein ABR964_14960 [Tepidisphaeraceae bacterium]|jgi:hypothetical protein
MTGLLRTCLAAAVFATLMAAGGCNAVGAAAYAAHGPTKIKPQYVFGKQPVLVLAESWGNAGDVSADAAQLGDLLPKTLTDHEAAKPIDPQKLERLRDQNPDKYARMTIDGIGRATGAKQVLYINVRNVQVDAPGGGQTMRGQIVALVRVVDSNSAETLWPPDAQAGALVQTQTPWMQRADNPATAQRQMHRQMVEQMADEIAKLFYEWQPEHETPPQ